MKLEKAIEILTQRSKDFRPGFDPDECDAINLGREALNIIKKLRKYGFPDDLIKLPGETPEGESP